MTFKDLLDKYSNGTASEEELRLIEEELEKHEVISEYLSKSYNIGFEKFSPNESIIDETTFVKRSVNKKLRKVVLLSVSIVFILLLTINYIVSPIISSFYYNPSQNTVSKYHEDLYFDVRVFTELNLPGYAIGTASSEKLGFGEYNIYFERMNLFNRENKYINVEIKRNSRTGSFQDFFASDHLGFMDIKEPDDLRDRYIKMHNEEIINHIQELNPVSYVSSYVIFEEDISVKEFDELRKKYNSINFKWVGVRTEGKDNPVNYLSGFNPNFNDGSVSGDSADRNKYPFLQLIDYLSDAESRKSFDGSFAEAYSKHFISLLKYMNDREKAVEALDFNSAKVEYYKNALSYVENNGINIYGFLVYGEAREMLEFISNEKIKAIELEGVLPSKYIN